MMSALLFHHFEIRPLKIFHHLFFEICSGRFAFWRFFQEIFHFREDVFTEICPLKICSGDFSFHEDMFMEISPLKIGLGDFSIHEDVFMEICPLKIYLADFSFYEDVFMEICPLKIEL